MKTKVFALLLTVFIVLNTLPANATALVPAVTGQAVAELAGTAVGANIIASLLSNGFNLDFSSYSGTSDEFFQSLTFTQNHDELITSDIIGLQEKYGHDYDDFLDFLLKSLGNEVESEVVPFKPWNRSQLERVVVNLSTDDFPDPGPTYPVDAQTLELAKMIKDCTLVNSSNRTLKDIMGTEVSSLWNVTGSYSPTIPSGTWIRSFISIGGSVYPPIMYVPFEVRLFYNLTDNSLKYYYFNHISYSWEILANNPASSGWGYFTTGSGTNKYYILCTDNLSGNYIIGSRTSASVSSSQSLGSRSGVSLNSLLQRYVGVVNNLDIYVGNDIDTALPILAVNPLPSVVNFGQGAKLETPGKDLPIVGVYPPNTFINLRPLIDLIIQAINDKDVLTFDDIKPLIVDVNGQQAVASVQIVRTDYDILFDEQYDDLFPRPNFSTDNDSMRAVVSLVPESAKIIEYVEVVPSSVMLPVVGCGIILLFALVLRRMLD